MLKNQSYFLKSTSGQTDQTSLEWLQDLIQATSLPETLHQPPSVNVLPVLQGVVVCFPAKTDPEIWVQVASLKEEGDKVYVNEQVTTKNHLVFNS